MTGYPICLLLVNIHHILLFNMPKIVYFWGMINSLQNVIWCYNQVIIGYKIELSETT